jgi:methylglyoxal synthase
MTSSPPVLAIIAHDGMKDAIVEFAIKHEAELGEFRLTGTATTAQLVSDATKLAIMPVLSGPYGGDVQIAAKVADGEISAVIFLVDPLNAHPHEPDIQAVLRVCNVHNVPLATNVATAHLLLSHDHL